LETKLVKILKWIRLDNIYVIGGERKRAKERKPVLKLGDFMANPQNFAED